jgi:hypothetical protein
MKKFLINFVSISLLSVLLLPVISHGQNTKIHNPLQSSDLVGIVKLFLNAIIKIGSVVCIIFLVYSGFLFVKAKGNPGEITKAKDTFMWTIVGIVILLGAQVIANIVTGTITSVTG